jgi:hypothetical protein
MALHKASVFQKRARVKARVFCAREPARRSLNAGACLLGTKLALAIMLGDLFQEKQESEAWLEGINLADTISIRNVYQAAQI